MLTETDSHGLSPPSLVENKHLHPSAEITLSICWFAFSSRQTASSAAGYLFSPGIDGNPNWSHHQSSLSVGFRGEVSLKRRSVSQTVGTAVFTSLNPQLSEAADPL